MILIRVERLMNESRNDFQHEYLACFCRMILAGEVGLLVAKESLFVSEDKL